MCWFGNLASKIATEDIQVYKIFFIKNDIILSPIFSFIWEKGITYETSINTSRIYNSITNGFHSLRDYPVLIDNDWYTKSGHNILLVQNQDKVLKVIIPKGSTYYENVHGEIVSNKLKIAWQQ